MPASPSQIREIEADTWLWLLTLFPDTFTNRQGELIPPAPEHHDFWEWVDEITPGVAPEAWIGCWPRGRAKSTSAELAVIRLGVPLIRPYAWYISETQKQSDLHLEAIGDKLESPTFGDFYPEHAAKKIGKFGTQRAWRQSRLTTQGGMTVESVGLDTAARGMKVGDERPGLLVFDDIDGRHDSVATTARKATTIAETLIPAGSADRVVLFIQNMIHPRSIMAALTGKHEQQEGIEELGDEFLARRRLSYREAVEGLEFERTEGGEYMITAGTPTWDGQGLEWAETEINTIGPSSFLGEYNHDTEPPAGKVFSHIDWQTVRLHEPHHEVAARCDRIVVWMDPAITSTDGSDSFAIQVDGVDAAGIIYRFWSWEQITTPEDAMARAMVAALVYQAQYIGLETDQGGDTWRSVFKIARTALIDGVSEHSAAAASTHRDWKRRLRDLGLRDEKAGQGVGSKVARVSQMTTPYETNLIRHVFGPTTRTLERALYRFPNKPLDLADVNFWSWWDLTQGGEAAAAPDPVPMGPEEDPMAARRRSRVWGNRPAARRPGS